MITKDSLKKFRADFDKAVEELGKKYNVKIELGNIRYTDTEFHTKMTATVLGATSQKVVNSKANFELFAPFFGLKAEDYGKSFVAKGRKFTITGINNRATKSPVELVDEDGKVYKTSVDGVKMFLMMNGEK